MREILQAPFSYFGGKGAVAEKIWQALGQPKCYIEPFFGSGAVLLSRPDYNPNEHMEIINDKNGFVANAWRSLQFSPDETARWADWPVNHADLTARKAKLLKNEDKLLECLTADDTWHDPVLAGYWIWMMSCTICFRIHSLEQIPTLNTNAGVNKISQRDNIYNWFRNLSKRLRYVKVVCGDWTRVCGGNWQDDNGICGIFFDPPYGVDDREKVYFKHDTNEIANDVNKWCIERGKLSSYRIVLTGYEEHMNLVHEHGWRCENWKTHGGYGNMRRTNIEKNINRYREKIYYSPYCIHNYQESLFNGTNNL